MQAIVRTKAGKEFPTMKVNPSTARPAVVLFPASIPRIPLVDIASKGLDKRDLGKVIVF